MIDLSHWDSTAELTGGEAAALIVGLDPGDPNAPLYRAEPMLKLLKEGHRIARAFVSTVPITPDEFRHWRRSQWWKDGLMSVLFDSYPFLYQEPWPGRPDRPFEVTRRFGGPDGEFDAQKFARSEIQRWLDANGFSTKYAFQGQAGPVVTAGAGPETSNERARRRYQMCIDEGLTVPIDSYVHMPRGIGRVAKKEGISRQALVEDLRRYIASRPK